MRSLDARHEGHDAHRDQNWSNPLEMSASKHVYHTAFYRIRFWMQVNIVFVFGPQSSRSAWCRRRQSARTKSRAAYLGDWHSHSMPCEQLSRRDIVAQIWLALAGHADVDQLDRKSLIAQMQSKIVADPDAIYSNR